MALSATLRLVEATPAPAATRIYDVTGRVTLPEHGEIVSEWTVQLTDVIGGDDGEPLVALTVTDGVTRTARRGSAPQGVQPLPFFFRRAPSGVIEGVLHHPDEEPTSLGTKKALAASHQLVIGHAAAGSTQAWRATERDVVGPARATYSVRRALGRLSGRLLVQKQLAHAPSAAVPPGFKFEVNTTAVMDQGVAVVLRQSSLFSPVPSELAANYDSPLGAAPHRQEGYAAHAP